MNILFYYTKKTVRLDVDGVVKKILIADYIQEELEGIQHIW